MPGLRYHIRTYGCQMNERDSEALGCLLRDAGYVPANGEQDADILLFNTCSVRDQAERKAVGKVGIMKRLKRERPDVVIGVVGCMAQNRGEQLLEELPHVDLVVGTDRIHLLPEILADVLAGRRGQVHVEPGTEIIGELQRHEPGKVSAFVSVMRGCDQYCTYCIVPYVRGREKSRPIDDIVAEVRELAAHGTPEIFLLGQNITAYGLAELRKAGALTADASPFANLLRAVNDVPGVERIRFTSPHPRYMNAAFIEAVTSLPKVCQSFHIPLQSGSDRILQAMGRGYTAAEYLERLSRIRARLAEVTFTTDVIVGFPGETEEDFAATRRAMDEGGFEMAYIFKYSPRTGTQAAGLADDVPQQVKEERNQVLLKDLERRSGRANAKYVGRTVEVLVEGQSKREASQWTGRTRTAKVCIFPPVDGLRAGTLANVRIARVTPNSLFGEIVVG